MKKMMMLLAMLVLFTAGGCQGQATSPEKDSTAQGTDSGAQADKSPTPVAVPWPKEADFAEYTSGIVTYARFDENSGIIYVDDTDRTQALTYIDSLVEGGFEQQSEPVSENADDPISWEGSNGTVSIGISWQGVKVANPFNEADHMLEIRVGKA